MPQRSGCSSCAMRFDIGGSSTGAGAATGGRRGRRGCVSASMPNNEAAKVMIPTRANFLLMDNNPFLRR
jgi:hypothetical protein